MLQAINDPLQFPKFFYLRTLSIINTSLMNLWNFPSDFTDNGQNVEEDNMGTLVLLLLAILIVFGKTGGK